MKKEDWKEVKVVIDNEQQSLILAGWEGCLIILLLGQCLCLVSWDNVYDIIYGAGLSFSCSIMVTE